MHHPMTYTVALEPEKARVRLLAALREAGMHKGDASKALGCRQATLLAWIRKLGLEDAIDRMTAKAIREGWHHGKHGGRPADSPRIRAAKEAGKIPRAGWVARNPRKKTKKRAGAAVKAKAAQRAA